TAVAENPGCRYIFLGDYLDPYERITQTHLLQNLQEIILFKKENPENVILLFGNHDLHYFTADIPQSSRFNFLLSEQASAIFKENRHLFRYAFQDENCIFTHAGIAHKWFIEDFQGDLNRPIAEQLNNPKPEQIKALFRCGEERGGQCGATGGIFWADINELYEPLQGFTQIVGHNRVEDIYDHINNGGRIIFCDCLWNGHYLKI
ncbi:MAG: metallophosphoesterase, partial [Bacteroidales bacterium]|nr:metallophosphoesterase [Bacteroidales bacterium]